MKLYLIGNEKSQILLEILVTIFIVTTFIGVGYLAVRESHLIDLYSKNYSRAQEIINSERENLFQLAKANFDSISNATKTIDNFYYLTLSVADLDAYKKKLNLEVKWFDFFNREKKITYDFYLTDWRSAPLDTGEGGAGGGGGSDLSGDWSNPTTLTSFDLGAGNEGTDINVKNKTVFISSIASDDKKPDLFIIDVTNPQAPTMKSSFNTGKGVNALSVRGNYAYLAHNSTTQQLQIVNVSNEYNPSLIREITLPNNRSTPQAIFAFKDASTSKDYVAIGTKASLTGEELFIYDVSNVNEPVLVTSLETLISITDIFMLKRRLYLTLGYGVLGFLVVVDLSDVYQPQQLVSLQLKPENFLSIFPLNYDYVFIGASQNLYLFKTTASSSGGILKLIPSEVDSIETGGAVNDIYARENLAFLATAKPNQEFQAIDYSNKENLRLYSFYKFPNIASGIDYRDNYIYLSVRSNDALRILTSR